MCECSRRQSHSLFLQRINRSMHVLATVCHLVWAAATLLQAEPDSFFAAVAQEACFRISTFPPQELANVVWAYATLGKPQKLLFHLIAEEAVDTTTTETIVTLDMDMDAKAEVKVDKMNWDITDHYEKINELKPNYLVT